MHYPIGRAARVSRNASEVTPGSSPIGTDHPNAIILEPARDFAELLLVLGVEARTIRSLAIVAEVIHGAPCRFTDPARFSLAHGCKDR
ncbi:DUF763 domain-containing protein [Bosea sp. TAF32]|uniref:DUF763 domain-containing protein n=1 Tax=Bosea sp. TAF32 TaxID=3237482 RepID=UPI003F8E5327